MGEYNGTNTTMMTEGSGILLALLPFWTPQIPPMGISSLKSVLQMENYKVRTVDANTDQGFRDIYNKYFDLLRSYVVHGKRGNFYNIGHDVLQNHMMANINMTQNSDYNELVRIIIYNTFYCQVTEEQIESLNLIIKEIFSYLDHYVLTLIDQEKPGLLGLSVYKGNLPASMYTFKTVRERYPQIKTAMGGAVFAQTLGIGTENFDFFLEKTKDYIDYIIVGEGELLFLKLLKGELKKDQRVFTREDIGNEVLRLESAQLPDFSDLDLAFYPTFASYTSRSCPYQCSFCSETVYWGKYRKKKATQVVDELNKISKKYKTQLFLMCDSLLNPIINDLTEEMLKQTDSVYWDGYLRVDEDTANLEKVYLWRQAGFYRARLGVESGSQKILDLMDKKIAIEETKIAIRNLAQAGIKTTTYWIIGYPGETESDFQMTLDLIEELKDDIYEAECNPFGYYLSGQVNSDDWLNAKRMPLYPESARDLLITQHWVLDVEPRRQETYERISRFVNHCDKLGIANPYSLYDIQKADARWKKLHKNAVPSLLEFKNTDVRIDENKRKKQALTLENKLEECTDDFDFDL